MEFNSFGLHKITSAHVPSMDPAAPTAVLSNPYPTTIDKSALRALDLQSNHSLPEPENPDSPPENDGKSLHILVPANFYENMNEGDNDSMVFQDILVIHESSNGSTDSDGNNCTPTSTTEERHLCQYCDRVYPSRTNLSRHIFRVHRIPARKKLPESLSDEFKGAICYEEGCDNKKFKSTTELRNHLVNEHNFIFQVVKNQLETEQQFITWKKNVEEACNIKWVKQAAKKKASGNTVVTYICHRSGRFRSNGPKRRALKSCKIGHFCTAYLKATIFDEPENGKKYSVELYPDHYGHDVVSKEEKKVKIQVAKCLTTTPVRGILISTTGVLFENGKYEAIKGSVVAVDKLRQLGLTIRFLTNDSRRTPSELVKKLQSLGFTVYEEEIISPIPVVIQTLQTLGLRPFLMVHPDIKAAFDNLDQTSPNCVVIGDMGNTVAAELFNKAYQVLISSPSPVLVKLGNEKYYKEKTELVLGAASYAAALEYACNTEAMVVGKPCYDYIMNAVNAMAICPQEIIMVGDDLDNDIQAAQRCGMRAVMVRTGKFRPDDAKHEVIKPDTIVKNLAHVVDMLVLKSKRESSGKCQDTSNNYPQHQKKLNRTSEPMEQQVPVPVPVPVSVPVPVPLSVPIQVHCDMFPFRFGPGPNGH